MCARASEVRPPRVVVTAIDEHSDAYAGGLRAGDLLLTVGSLAVEDAYEANSVMKRV